MRDNKAGILAQQWEYPEALEAYDTSRSCDADGSRGRSLPRRGYWKRWTWDSEALRIYTSISPTDPSDVDAVEAKARMMGAERETGRGACG